MIIREDLFSTSARISKTALSGVQFYLIRKIVELFDGVVEGQGQVGYVAERQFDVAVRAGTRFEQVNATFRCAPLLHLTGGHLSEVIASKCCFDFIY